VLQPDLVADFCRDSYIDLLFIPYSKTYSVEQWKTLISACSVNGVEVHALHGDAKWGLAAYQADGFKKIDDVMYYNREVDPGAKFTGIHLDVEPHSLDEWDSPETLPQLLKEWVENMKAFAARSRSYGMAFGADFAAWLDTNAAVIAATPPEWGKPLFEIMIDIVDTFGCMSYSDKAQGMIDLAAGEVAYPDSPKVLVGAELTQQLPASITFFEEGVLAMEDAIRQADEQFKTSAGYAGVAVHDFEDYELTRRRFIPKPAKRKLPPR